VVQVFVASKANWCLLCSGQNQWL